MPGKKTGPPSVERKNGTRKISHGSSLRRLLVRREVLIAALQILYWIVKLARAFDGRA